MWRTLQRAVPNFSSASLTILMHHAVNEHSIAEMVDTFYGKVRYDDLLGPIFDGVIGDNWGPHLDKMKAFWSSVLLASRTYKGNPMLAHLQLPRLTQQHFERWLQLWDETACSLCSEAVAFEFVGRARMIGARLLYAVSAYHESLDTPYETDRSAKIPERSGGAAPLDNATA